MKPAFGALLLAITLGGCLDFVEPELGPRGGVVLQGSVHLVGDDSVRIEAHLTPGIDPDKADFRVVAPDTLYVNGRAIQSSGVRRNQERDYFATLAADTTALRTTGIVIRGPGVQGIVTQPPVFRFPLIARVGPDTVDFTTGQDVRLSLRVLRPGGFIGIVSQDWRMELLGFDQSFVLGGNGQAPESILIPAEYVPTNTATVRARLFFAEIVQQRLPPGDYTATIAYDARLAWVLRRRAGSP